jgi:aspartyl-tRNA(Asn)/glutamyl-tRNA(Gln) amidotransferase subunit B
MASRFASTYNLSQKDALFLVSDRDLASYFENTLKFSGPIVAPKIVANWVMGDLMREVNAREWDLAAIPVTPEALGELLSLIGDGTISGRIAKAVFDEMIASGGMPGAIVKTKGLTQVSDRAAIEKVVRDIIDASPSQAEEYRAGKEKVFGYFVGQIMKVSKGKFNPATVNDVLRELLVRK